MRFSLLLSHLIIIVDECDDYVTIIVLHRAFTFFNQNNNIGV
jgi:hypothetical protein